MKHLDIKQIQEIIPHRHPFLLLDYVEDYEPGEYAVAYKCVSYREEFFAGHLINVNSKERSCRGTSFVWKQELSGKKDRLVSERLSLQWTVKK